MKKILVVEDRPSLVNLLKRDLEHNGYEIYTTYRGKEAPAIAARYHINLVLLDLMLPDVDGLCICEELRKQDPFLPIIILSILSDIGTKVQAFRSGADDYIVKPFMMEEVLERIKVQFLHAEHMRSGVEGRDFTAGPLSINFEQRRVLVDGQEINLTHKEYELLRLLVINNGKLVTYDFLLSQVWDDDCTSEYQSIHTYINRLRKKIETPTQRRFIQNEPRIGYRFKIDDKP
ncbi:MAG: response regulator transcription factor [Chloroflexota bacterium]|nr:response regulator transcription factor [Chloroflexota bacterium]